VDLAKGEVERVRAAAQAILGITLQVAPSAPRAPKSRRRPPSSRPHRPLLIRSNAPAPAPVLVVVTPQVNPLVSGVRSGVRVEERVEGVKVVEEAPDFSTLNSYQRAKLRCADKFKCDECGKGFPLGCLLQRHKRTHQEIKPHRCSYCAKGFSSKTTLNHHMFMQHLEQRTRRVEEGRRLIERLKKADNLPQTLQEHRNNHMNSVVKGGEVREQGMVVEVAEKEEEFVLPEDPAKKGEGKSVEIIGVQDITQQISVQMGKESVRDTVIEVVDTAGNVTLGSLTPCRARFPGENMYYLDGESTYTWEYPTPTSL